MEEENKKHTTLPKIHITKKQQKKEKLPISKPSTTNHSSRRSSEQIDGETQLKALLGRKKKEIEQQKKPKTPFLKKIYRRIIARSPKKSCNNNNLNKKKKEETTTTTTTRKKKNENVSTTTNKKRKKTTTKVTGVNTKTVRSKRTKTESTVTPSRKTERSRQRKRRKKKSTTSKSKTPTTARRTPTTARKTPTTARTSKKKKEDREEKVYNIKPEYIKIKNMTQQKNQKSLRGTKIGKKYIIVNKIGGGSFGDIFLGMDLKSGDQVAIKVEKNSKRSVLHQEAKLINYLTKHAVFPNGAGYPRFRWYGIWGKYNILVMDVLGKSLERLFDYCGRQFSLKTVLMLADQMIRRLEFLHSKNIIHRDIKPDNFLIGIGNQAHVVYLIDFGLSKVYKSKGEHIPFRDNKSLTGTLRYASVFTHLGYEQSRRDDLECLGYVLIYFLKGKLPWQGMRAKDKDEKYKKVADCKRTTPVEELCAGIPVEFQHYIRHARKLGFEEKPDYRYMRRLFIQLFKDKGYVKDYIYDWTKLDAKKEKSASSLSSQIDNKVTAAAPSPAAKNQQVKNNTTALRIKRRSHHHHQQQSSSNVPAHHLRSSHATSNNNLTNLPQSRSNNNAKKKYVMKHYNQSTSRQSPGNTPAHPKRLSGQSPPNNPNSRYHPQKRLKINTLQLDSQLPRSSSPPTNQSRRLRQSQQATNGTSRYDVVPSSYY